MIGEKTESLQSSLFGKRHASQTTQSLLPGNADLPATSSGPQCHWPGPGAAHRWVVQGQAVYEPPGLPPPTTRPSGILTGQQGPPQRFEGRAVLFLFLLQILQSNRFFPEPTLTIGLATSKISKLESSLWETREKGTGTHRASGVVLWCSGSSCCL